MKNRIEQRGGNPQELDEVDIANNDVYLSNMAKSFPDKAWFIRYVDPDIDTVVDFGGGSGEFCEYVKAKLERPDRSVRFIVIDNNEAFAAAARSRGFMTFPSLPEMRSSGKVDLENSLLVMSSVIHEVYSYATGPGDISGFWSAVAACGFRQIAIRDMSLNYGNFTNVPVEDVIWVYENVFKDPGLTVKGARITDLLGDFEDEWGALCDPALGKVNVKNLVHFLIKYRYVENWDRELHENYLPITQDRLEGILTGMGYSFVRKESSKLPFYAKTWAKDFKLRRPDNDRPKARVLAWLETRSTHIKWLVAK